MHKDDLVVVLATLIVVGCPSSEGAMIVGVVSIGGQV